MSQGQTKVTQEPAWILHSRPFKESSLILDCLTENYGRIAVIARGVRGGKKSQRGLLQPFRPLLISFSGKTELKTLVNTEPMPQELLQGYSIGAQGIPLQGDRLYAGFYVNELLTRLLPNADAVPTIYSIYLLCIHQLLSDNWQWALRRFECALLDELGYGLQLAVETDGVTPVSSEKNYYYYIEQGPVAVADIEFDSQHRSKLQTHFNDAHRNIKISGATLLALAINDANDSDAQTLLSTQPSDVDLQQESARLMKACLSHYLGHKPLKSRELWKSIKQRTAKNALNNY